MFAYTKIMQALAAAGVVPASSDPYFNLTTLLLNTSSTNGAQNNTFLDSSTNNFTITRNGNATQGTFTPFSQTGWSNYFGGTSYLSIANNANLNLGSSNFTIEFWVYAPSSTNPNAIISKGNTSSLGSDAWSVEWTNTTGTLGFGSGAFNAWAAPIVTGTVTLNSWNHVAVVRNGTTHTLYVNGILASTATASYTVTSAGSLYIGTGWYDPSSRYFVGYISNARLVIGTAVYTSNFSPSTTPLTAITNTQLLTCQSNRFIDNSTNAFAITVNGSPSVQAFSPFTPTTAYDAAVVGGSGYFDGSGDYLQCSVSASPTGTQNFTIEGWIYVPTANTEYAILDNNNSSGGFYLRVNTSGQINVVHTNIAGIINSSSSVKANSWNYFCVTRSGNTFNIYLNSTSVDATTSNSVSFSTGTDTFVGAYYNGALNFTGYMSSLRVVIGTATAPTSVPTAPLTAITNTSLLLNFTNAGIYDSAAKNVLETVGNAQVSTTQAKWGTTSMYFDGSTSSWLLVPFNRNIDLSTGSPDWTIELWGYVSSFSNSPYFFNKGGVAASTYTNYGIEMTTGGAVSLALGNNGGQTTYSFGTISTSTWYHFAATRQGNTIKTFLNGTLVTNNCVRH